MRSPDSSARDSIAAKFAKPADCRHEEGPGHDCDYVDWRNRLIGVAENDADALCGEKPRYLGRDESKEWKARWDACFHAKMTALTTNPLTGATAYTSRGRRAAA